MIENKVINEDFVNTDKIIGINVRECVNKDFELGTTAATEYTIKRTKFANYLRANGYSIKIKGCYISAKKGDENNVFYFASHTAKRKNYLIPASLKYVVNYFVFYDNEKSCVYKVSYSKVSEFCKQINRAYTFGFGKDMKLFVSDKWAHSQILNTTIIDL